MDSPPARRFSMPVARAAVISTPRNRHALLAARELYFDQFEPFQKPAAGKHSTRVFLTARFGLVAASVAAAVLPLDG